MIDQVRWNEMASRDSLRGIVLTQAEIIALDSACQTEISRLVAANNASARRTIAALERAQKALMKGL